MRRRRPHRALPATWQTVAAQRLRVWDLLDDDERQRLGTWTGHLLAKRWEAANGFAIDETMTTTVALHAALLALGHDEPPFRNVTAVVIHPATMVVHGPRPGPSRGVVTDSPLRAHGHTSARGPVHIAWGTVTAELAASPRTSNVILHEFAHKMDALAGALDGTPVLGDRDQLQEWVQVCTAELDALRRGGSPGLLRPYAATNPSEFFAVATETFFEQSLALRAAKPRLYRVLARFFRQDTAAREEGPVAAPPADTGAASAVTRAVTVSQERP